MKITKYLFQSLLVTQFLLFTGVVYTLPEESVSQMEQISQELKVEKLSDSLMKKAYIVINQLACVLSDLATMDQEESATPEEKKARIAHIREIISTRKSITAIANELDNNPTPQQLHTALALLNQIVAHLEGYLKTNFVGYAAFDLDAHRKRLTVIDATTLTETSLANSLSSIETTIKNVQTKVETSGLTLWNRFIRATLVPVVEVVDKYNLHWKALYTTVALSTVAYLWHHLDRSTDGLPKELKVPVTPHALPHNIEEITLSYDPNDTSIKGYLGYLHDKINYIIRKVSGWPVVSSRDTMNDGSVQLPINTFGRIEKALWDAKAGFWTLGALAFEPVRTAIVKTYKEYSKKISDAIVGWYNKAKGGAYYKRYKNQRGADGRIEPRYTFDDIIGLDNAKEILSTIIKYMKDPELYDRAGLTPAKGYLLYGLTRTGKTMLAEALAGEIQKIFGSSKKLPFYVVEARWIAHEGNFDQLIYIAKREAPCVIFIDEIDMLNLHRDEFKDKTVLLSEFLSTLSGCMNADPDKQVIIIAATNRPEKLDKALLKRFAVHIPFEYPSFINRAQFFMQVIEGKGLPLDQFNIKKLAEQTEGSSFETLHKAINNAQFIARDQSRPLTQFDIEASLNTEIHGIIQSNYIELPQNEQQILSVHMAGHAVAYIATEDTGIRMSQVTIRPVKTEVNADSILNECLKTVTLPNILYGKVFTHHKADSLKFLSKNEIERMCMIELAGHVAEKLILGSHHSTTNTCSHYDTTKAFYWARKYQLDGLDEALIEKSTSLQDEITRKAYVFMQQCEAKMHELLASRIELIKLVAEVLQNFGTVGGGEDMEMLLNVYKMLNGRTLEEFVAEETAKQKSAAQASQHDTPKQESVEQERSALKNEFDIDEVTADASAPHEEAPNEDPVIA
jgi:ATP-dependent Zn protease